MIDCGLGKKWSTGHGAGVNTAGSSAQLSSSFASCAFGVNRSLIRARCAPLSPAPQGVSTTSGFPVSLRNHFQKDKPIKH
jgi:hypothetical protein